MSRFRLVRIAKHLRAESIGESSIRERLSRLASNVIRTVVPALGPVLVASAITAGMPAAAYAAENGLTDTTNPSARLIASSKTNEAASTYYAGVRINENTYTY